MITERMALPKVRSAGNRPAGFTTPPGFAPPAPSTPPAGLAVVIAAIGRTLILEEGLGSSGGHLEAVALVNRFLDRFEMPEPKAHRGHGAD